jgi:adenylate cyclase
MSAQAKAQAYGLARIQHLRGRLLRLYAVAATVSVSLGSSFFLFGLDLKYVHMRVVFGIIIPLATIPMVIAMFWAIRTEIAPLRAFFEALPGEEAEPTEATRKLAGPALVRALNLPFLSALRVMVVHLPAFGVPTMLLVALLNRAFWLGIHDFQFGFLGLTLLVFAAAHAIAEYFGAAAAVRSLIPLLRRHADPLAPDLAPRVVQLSVRRKLLAISGFVVVVPLVALGATVLLKSELLLTPSTPGDEPPLRLPLVVWVSLFVVIASVIAVGMLAAMAREIAWLTGTLRRAMHRVESGALATRLDISSTDEFADLYEGFNRMTAGLGEREKLRDAFGRYVAPEIAEKILEDGAHLGGTTVNASVLFADIRGFTSLSERLRPAEVVGLLNRYIAAMDPAIRRERGWINKFGGDSILAVFGAPVAEANHAELAVRAALGMRAALASFNEAEREISGEHIEIGIGVHTGEMVAGSIGSPERLEYTVIGDVVNVAARLQALNKELGTRILISAAAREAAGADYPARALPPVAVRGKSAEMAIYTLDGTESREDELRRVAAEADRCKDAQP